MAGFLAESGQKRPANWISESGQFWPETPSQARPPPNPPGRCQDPASWDQWTKPRPTEAQETFCRKKQWMTPRNDRRRRRCYVILQFGPTSRISAKTGLTWRTPGKPHESVDKNALNVHHDASTCMCVKLFKQSRLKLYQLWHVKA